MALGVWDVEKRLAITDPRQIDWWMAYERLEPFGEERADLRSAMAATATCNLLSSAETRFTLSDFMPFAEFSEEDEIEEACQDEAVMEAIMEQRMMEYYASIGG